MSKQDNPQNHLNSHEEESLFAGKKGAYLALVEVGLGSLLHSFHVPLAGTFLSLNQSCILTSCLKQAKGKNWPRVLSLRISWVAALLKSLSPTGKKLTPMLAIASQGLLFSIGPMIFGHCLLGALFGAFLASFWSFLQPALFAVLIFGPFLSESLFHDLSRQWAALLKIFPILQKIPFVQLLVGFIVLKAVLSLAATALIWFSKRDFSAALLQKMPVKPVKISQETGKKEFLYQAKAAFKDLKRSIFWLPLLILVPASLLTYHPLSSFLLYILRPFAAGYLFFLVVRIATSRSWPSYSLISHPDMIHGVACFFSQSAGTSETKVDKSMLFEQMASKRLLRRAASIWKEEGIASVFQKGMDKLRVFISYPGQKKRFSRRQFTFQSQRLPYFIHHYNATWRNERCIEIALAQHYLNKWQSGKVLELGNVMAYYGPYHHEVVDKYEPTEGIINKDFVDYAPSEPFDTFISISTFEHIGWDEAEKSKEKLLACFNKISSLVKNKDQVLVSFPLGYNDFLDEIASQGLLPFSKQSCLIRKDLNQTWEERPIQEGLKACYRYGSKFPGANACFFGVGIV